MTLTFILIAGSLAAAAGVLLLLPLVRRRADSSAIAPRTAIITALLLLSASAGLYATLSDYTWSEALSNADSPAAMTARLAKRLAADPDNAARLDDWLMLGRSYQQLEQFPLAVRAFQRADQLSGGENVDAVLGAAESLLAQDAGQLDGPAGRLFERALEMAPTNAKALFYSSFAALGRGDLPVARERFQRMLALQPPAQIQAIIQQRVRDIDAALAAKEQGETNEARITVQVSLAPALAASIPAGAVLFVAARDPAAPGPPFAVKRLPATFPMEVVLTAADAMMPSRRITSGQQLEVVARVALGGTPTASSGDPFGEVAYRVGTDGRRNIIIDRLAP